MRGARRFEPTIGSGGDETDSDGENEFVDASDGLSQSTRHDDETVEAAGPRTVVVDASSASDGGGGISDYETFDASDVPTVMVITSTTSDPLLKPNRAALKLLGGSVETVVQKLLEWRAGDRKRSLRSLNPSVIESFNEENLFGCSWKVADETQYKQSKGEMATLAPDAWVDITVPSRDSDAEDRQGDKQTDDRAQDDRVGRARCGGDKWVLVHL